MNCEKAGISPEARVRDDEDGCGAFRPIRAAKESPGHRTSLSLVLAHFWNEKEERESGPSFSDFVLITKGSEFCFQMLRLSSACLFICHAGSLCGVSSLIPLLPGLSALWAARLV